MLGTALFFFTLNHFNSPLREGLLFCHLAGEKSHRGYVTGPSGTQCNLSISMMCFSEFHSKDSISEFRGTLPCL